MSSVRDNLARVHDRVRAAARRAGRPDDAVTLIAVTKGFPVDRALEAIAAGADVLGESRVQEAREKWPSLEGKAPVHMIGHLQRNKVAHAVEMFDVIHSVDSTRLVAAINRRAAGIGKRQEVLIELNLSGDASKHGADADALDEVLEACRAAASVRVRGLMTIAPLDGGEVGARRTFAALRERLPEVRSAFPDATELSMGMSGDFEIAIEEGATLVRVGSAIFGARAVA